MHSSLQQAYLDAMDIAVWSLRQPASPETGTVKNHVQLKLSPGNAGSLLICMADADSAGRLANDISRTLGRALSGPGRLMMPVPLTYPAPLTITFSPRLQFLERSWQCSCLTVNCLPT